MVFQKSETIHLPPKRIRRFRLLEHHVVLEMYIHENTADTALTRLAEHHSISEQIFEKARRIARDYVLILTDMKGDDGRYYN